nr:serine/threonine-protein kinase prpf4B [Ipomoea batatas]
MLCSLVLKAVFVFLTSNARSQANRRSHKGLVKQSAQPVQGVNLASEVDVRADDADTYVGDQEFSVRKSPRQDNLSVNEQSSGDGGL